MKSYQEDFEEQIQREADEWVQNRKYHYDHDGDCWQDGGMTSVHIEAEEAFIVAAKLYGGRIKELREALDWALNARQKLRFTRDYSSDDRRADEIRFRFSLDGSSKNDRSGGGK